MYDVGALVGWGLRAVRRHVELVWFVDDDDVALQWKEWREMDSELTMPRLWEGIRT